MRRSLDGSSYIALVVYVLPLRLNVCPVAPPTWPAVMKCRGLIGVPVNEPQLPWNCQPLLRFVPDGAAVFRVDVRERITALAGCASANHDAAATATRVTIRRGRNRCITTPLGEIFRLTR